MINAGMYKIVLSKPKNSLAQQKRIEIIKNKDMYQASLYGAKKVVHKNMGFDEANEFVQENFANRFMQFNAWDENLEYESKASKKGKVISSRKVPKNPPKKPVFAGIGFDRQKNHIIREGDEVHALVDMGVFTKDFRLIGQKRDKFVQINRYLEIINDEIRGLDPKTKFNIIDIGCGKSYLTFLMHHYFTKIQGFDAQVHGLDVDADLIKKCHLTAEQHGLKHLVFSVGDIKILEGAPQESFGDKGRFSVAISLHACDVATDYALKCAVEWGADLILSAPCCQHELAGQIAPKNLTIFAEYGIIRERFSSIATDLVRAKFLESVGYREQVIEFTGFNHTEKNLLIRARRTGRQNAAALTDIKKLCDEFGFSPALLNLVR